MKLPSSGKQLTELEGAVLATIARRGAMTAYAIKEMFRGSPSGFWSGSAGAVYPLIKRLEARGLLDAQAGADGKRAKSVLDISKAGRAALADWIADAGRATDMGYDPLRTRMQFLDLLPPARRKRFLDDVDDRLMAPVMPDEAPENWHRLHKVWLEGRRNWLRRFLDRGK